MTAARYAALRAALAQATPGPWYTIGPPWNNGSPWINGGNSDPHGGKPVCDLGIQDVNEDDSEGVAVGNSHADAAYIAACSPDVIGALLDDLDAAERERDALRAAAKHALTWIVGENHVDAVIRGDEHKQHDNAECCVCHARAALRSEP